MAVAYTGNNGTVTVDGTNMCVTQFQFTKTNTDEDTTSTCDAGWDDQIVTSRNIQGSFSYHYDPDKHEGLMAGETVTLVLTLPGGTASGPATLTSVQVTSQVKQTVKGVANFKSKGPWTIG